MEIIPGLYQDEILVGINGVGCGTAFGQIGSLVDFLHCGIGTFSRLK